MNDLQSRYRQAVISEMVDGRKDILEFVHEMESALTEYNTAMVGVEENYLIEAGSSLSVKQITNLFRSASTVSQGKPIAKDTLTNSTEKSTAAEKLSSEMITAIKIGEDKLQNNEPVQMFDMKVTSILNKWKKKLGNDHKAVKLAVQLGEYGKEHPKKTPFIIGTLTTLISAVDSPAFEAAVVVAMETALRLAKGEQEQRYT